MNLSRPHPQYFHRSVDDFGGKIPFIVSDLIARIAELNGTHAEGIFRISGATRDVSALCLELDAGRVTDWSAYGSVHAVACALKKYFRDMAQSDPLIPPALYDAFLRAPAGADPVADFRAIVAQLSAARRRTLAFLVRFLAEVAASPTSKMGAGNLAIVLSPNLLRAPAPTADADEALRLNALQNRAFAHLIERADAVFAGVDVGARCFVADSDMRALAAPPLRAGDVAARAELRRESLIPFVPNSLLQEPAHAVAQ